MEAFNRASPPTFVECFRETTMITNFDFIPKCLKISAYFVNVLYWVLGTLSVGIGFYVHMYQILAVQQLILVQFSPAFMLIVMGIVLFITAIFGFVGALRENMCFLRWYLAILLFILMVHIAMGVVAFVVMFFPPIVNIQVEEMLQNALIIYKDDDQSADYINKIQTSIQCCGVSQQGYRDWLLNPYFACSDYNFSAESCSVPASCCRFDSLERIDSTCGFGTTHRFISQLEASSVIYTQGCVSKAEEIVQKAAALLGFFAFGTATALICGIALSSRMVNTLQIKINEYWKNFNSEDCTEQYVSNLGIYHIPEPHSAQKTVPAMNSKIYKDNFFTWQKYLNGVIHMTKPF